MKNTSLLRSMSYWLLLVLSLASAAIGGWLVWDSTTTMLRTILDGSATNVEVYVGQAWITSGAALLAAGLVGVFLSLVLSVARALIPTTPVIVEPIDWTAAGTDASTPDPSTGSGVEGSVTETATETELESERELVDQNGSSGSIATATNSNVR